MEDDKTAEVTAAPAAAEEPAPAPATPSADAQGRLEAARRFAEEQYDRLRQATAQQMETARRFATEQMENARRYTDTARRQINEGWDVTCDKAKDLHRVGQEYVRSNPTGSVLGALGVGVILGLLIGGRK
ncbi:MAG: hypothetical protein ACI4PY_02920 [Akkermansia muciniphila]